MVSPTIKWIKTKDKMGDKNIRLAVLLVFSLKFSALHYPAILAQFSIGGIPTIIIFKNGSEVHRAPGALDQNSIINLVSNFI